MYALHFINIASNHYCLLKCDEKSQSDKITSAMPLSIDFDSSRPSYPPHFSAASVQSLLPSQKNPKISYHPSDCYYTARTSSQRKDSTPAPTPSAFYRQAVPFWPVWSTHSSRVKWGWNRESRKEDISPSCGSRPSNIANGKNARTWSVSYTSFRDI